MHTIGLLGGMSWHSTVDYYRAMNQAAAEALGGHHSAPILLSSVDFATIRECQTTENWVRAGMLLADEARNLEAGGARAIAICTNLMHKVSPAVSAAVEIPVLHIGDAVAASAKDLGVTRLGILGTDWTMREPFYRDRLAAHGIGVVVPDADDRVAVDRIIWEELTRGIVTDASRAVYSSIVDALAARGAQAVVLACTEIQLLVSQSDLSLPVIDSLDAHVQLITDFMLDRSTVIA